MDPLTAELEAGIAAARAGAKDQARTHLLRVLQADQTNETAWLWLSGVMLTTEQALRCIDQLLAINPQHHRAKEAQKMLRIRLLVEEAAIFKDPLPPPSTSQSRLLLSELLVELGLITLQQLDQVLAEQAHLMHKKRRPVRLGEILMRRKLVRRAQLEAVLAIQIEHAVSPAQESQGPPSRIGEFLVQRGLMTREQLAYALMQQKALRQQGRSLHLGEVLVQLRYLPRAQLHHALLEWHRIHDMLFD
jgi:hypothetical protein